MELTENRTSARIRALGEILLRYGLVLVLAWIGTMKFTAYEAEGINHWSRRAFDESDVKTLEHSGHVKRNWISRADCRAVKRLQTAEVTQAEQITTSRFLPL